MRSPETNAPRKSAARAVFPRRPLPSPRAVCFGGPARDASAGMQRRACRRLASRRVITPTSETMRTGRMVPIAERPRFPPSRAGRVVAHPSPPPSPSAAPAERVLLLLERDPRAGCVSRVGRAPIAPLARLITSRGHFRRPRLSARTLPRSRTDPPTTPASPSPPAQSSLTIPVRELDRARLCSLSPPRCLMTGARHGCGRARSRALSTERAQRGEQQRGVVQRESDPPPQEAPPPGRPAGAGTPLRRAPRSHGGAWKGRGQGGRGTERRWTDRPRCGWPAGGRGAGGGGETGSVSPRGSRGAGAGRPGTGAAPARGGARRFARVDVFAFCDFCWLCGLRCGVRARRSLRDRPGPWSRGPRGHDASLFYFCPPLPGARAFGWRSFARFLWLWLVCAVWFSRCDVVCFPA